MKRDVRLTAKAENDLQQLQDFLADKNPDASLRAAATITEIVARIKHARERR